jgi:SH3-like domain-containing protein
MPAVTLDTSKLATHDASATSASWEEVKATTWVNVRADRRRDASIVAVLNPDEVVRLGARESGWRQVNVDGATGWVDGRHFTPSARQ